MLRCVSRQEGGGYRGVLIVSPGKGDESQTASKRGGGCLGLAFCQAREQSLDTGFDFWIGPSPYLQQGALVWLQMLSSLGPEGDPSRIDPQDGRHAPNVSELGGAVAALVVRDTLLGDLRAIAARRPEFKLGQSA